MRYRYKLTYELDTNFGQDVAERFASELEVEGREHIFPDESFSLTSVELQPEGGEQELQSNG